MQERMFRILALFSLLTFLITIHYACNNIKPKDGFDLTLSTCVREINTTNCPDSSLFHMLVKGRAYGPVGTYVVVGSDFADSTALDCGSWTFETDGRTFGCFRAADQNKETVFSWRGYYLICLPLNSYWDDLPYFVATHTALSIPYYLVDDQSFSISCRP